MLSSTAMDRCSPTAVLDLTDDDLVAQLQSGEVEAPVTSLERRYGKRIHAFVLGMVRDSHLAQDITQEVFEKVMRKHALYSPGTNFRAWLFEVARNQALSTLRREQRLPRPFSGLQHDQGADMLDAFPAAPAEQRLEEEEMLGAFEAAVAALPERYRTVFDLCVRQGRPYQDAARQLHVPTGTVAIRIMRARKRLFADLQQHLGRLRRPPACFQ